jgi:hypothetical protein
MARREILDRIHKYVDPFHQYGFCPHTVTRWP